MMGWRHPPTGAAIRALPGGAILRLAVLRGIPMKRRLAATLLLAASAFAPAELASGAEAGWVTLFDANTQNLNNWDRTGDANWRIVNGVLEATMGGGHLVTKNEYTNFEIRAEFWVDADANSGLFIRCSDRAMIGAMT